MIYSLGVDLSKDEFSACLQSYQLSHQVISRKTFKNKPSGPAELYNKPAPVRLTMEATGVTMRRLHVREHSTCQSIYIELV
jgi:hypothetical protein